MSDPKLQLAEETTEVDGVSPLNEASRIAIQNADAARIDQLITSDGEPIAVAYAPTDAPVEVFVVPKARRQGHGTQLMRDLLDAGEHQFWAHGDLPAAQSLARKIGLERTRVLLILSRDTTDPLPAMPNTGAVTIRTWRDSDAEELVRINAQAFASHPEQGAMDMADLQGRMAQPWFDPAGLFIAERDGEVIGFHWTKIEDQIGEVYVVGVAPQAQGSGLGRALTLRGLHYLTDRDVARIDLYVEGDNTAALATYHGLGFAESARDAVYSRPH